MVGTRDLSSLERRIAAIARDAEHDHAIPPEVVRRARRSTLRRFAQMGDVPASRAKAYFWGVVRSEAHGRASAPVLRERYLAATIAEDMFRAGHTIERVAQEVQRRCGVVVAPPVLETVRAAVAPASLRTSRT